MNIIYEHTVVYRHSTTRHECMDLSFIQPNVDIMVSYISYMMPTYTYIQPSREVISGHEYTASICLKVYNSQMSKQTLNYQTTCIM